ncbi:MAG: glycosyl transferase, partial [Hyphomicrobiales bacterium]|nr:glycosyl transferase [Hyphomicrobiales bacterium]
MTKTVLFAWELGLGLGHLMNMHRIARRLARHDCRTILASSKVTAALALQSPFDEIIQAPKWPLDALPEERRLVLSSATLNDVLSGVGLADRIAVEGLLGSWLEMFKSKRPALVIADF